MWVGIVMALSIAVLHLILLFGVQLGALALYSSPALMIAKCSGGYRTIAVSATTSCKNAGSCLSSNGSIPCCTLEYVLRMGIPACSRVVVDSDNETLHQTTVVNGSHDFILQGSGPGAGKMSTVYCTSDVSLTFSNCQNIILLGMQFQACALSLMNCNNVTYTTSLAETSLKSLDFPCEGEDKDEDEGEDECELNYYYDPLKKKKTYFASDNVCYYRNTTCVRKGFWFGTLPSMTNNTHTYGAFPCPLGYCDFLSHCLSENCHNKTLFCELPEPNALCYGNRGGVLCSQCMENYTFTFDTIDCAPNENCSFGYIIVMIILVLLFWLLLVIAQLVVVYLDLHIGSGRLYCFIFFFSSLQFFEGSSFPSKFSFAGELLVTGVIQLNPNVFGLIPICIPGDHSHIVLGYALLRYAHPLFLVVVIVLLICISKRCALPLFHYNNRATNSICILLYLSFFSLTHTSFSFLVPVKFPDRSTVYASLDPTVIYFTSYHRFLVILALLTQVVLVVPFLALLVLSPWLVRWFNLLRLKPVLDEFQACYKDRYRCFAGFYLTWWLVIFLLSSFSDYYVKIYLLQVMAIVLLIVHAIFQPYKERWLNVLDTLFISDLVLLSILHGTTSRIVFESPGLMIFKVILLHLLVLFPMMYFVSLCLWLVLKRVHYFLLNYLHKGKTRRLRNVGVVVNDTDTHCRPFTAEREPLLFQQSLNSSVTNREYCDVLEPRLPTRSSVGLSGSATS